MLMGLCDRKGGSLGLEVEVDETCGPRLRHGLVEGIHGAELAVDEAVIVLGGLAREQIPVARGVKGAVLLPDAFDVLLVSLREVLFIFPDLVEDLGASFGRGVLDHAL